MHKRFGCFLVNLGTEHTRRYSAPLRSSLFFRSIHLQDKAIQHFGLLDRAIDDR